MLVTLHYQGAQMPVFGQKQKSQANLLTVSQVACLYSRTEVSACLCKTCAVQQKYTQAERGHAALDEDLTRGYIHNLEVHASQQERVGHYRKNEQAKREKVSNAGSGHCESVGGSEPTV